MFRKLRVIAAEIVVALLSLLMLVPFYMLIINSFKSKAEAAEMNLRLPVKWRTIENYMELIKNGGILTGFKNSLILTFASIAIGVVLISLSSFILQRSRERIAKAIYSLFILGMVLPGFIVTQVLLLNKMHIPGLIGVLLLFLTSAIPLGTFLYVGYYKSIPRELDESAIIDGCGLLKLFSYIVFPLAKPVTVTFIIVMVLTYWNDFTTTIYILSGKENQTITLIMFSYFGTHYADWNLVFACIVLATLPVVIVYFALQKYVVAGLTAGSVKG